MLAQEKESNFSYKDALSAAMEELADDPRTMFLGQGVACKGTFMSTTLQGVPLEKRLELPVAEEMQLGMSIGIALSGYIPISIFPRYNFLLLAMNQLVNHLEVMQAHVIVRVGVGSTEPLNPGLQHTGDMTKSFRLLMSDTTIVRLDSVESIIPEYRKALNCGGPTILVEIADLYESQT